MKSMNRKRKVFLRKTSGSDNEQPANTVQTPKKQTRAQILKALAAEAAASDKNNASNRKKKSNNAPGTTPNTPPVTPESDSGVGIVDNYHNHHHASASPSRVPDVIVNSKKSASGTVPPSSTPLGGIRKAASRVRMSLPNAGKKKNLQDDGTLMSDITDNRTYQRLDATLEKNDPSGKPPRDASQKHHQLNSIREHGQTTGESTDGGGTAAAAGGSKGSGSPKKLATTGGGGASTASPGGAAVASYHHSKILTPAQQQELEAQFQKKTTKASTAGPPDPPAEKYIDDDDISPAAFVASLFGGIVDSACHSGPRSCSPLTSSKKTVPTKPRPDFAPEWGVAPSMDQTDLMDNTVSQEKEKAAAKSTTAKTSKKKSDATAGTWSNTVRRIHKEGADEPPLDHLEDTHTDTDGESIFSGEETDEDHRTRDDTQPSLSIVSSMGATTTNPATSLLRAASPTSSGGVLMNQTTGGDTSNNSHRRMTPNSMDHENFEMVLEDLALQDEREQQQNEHHHHRSNHANKPTAASSMKAVSHAGARWMSRALGRSSKSKSNANSNTSSSNTFSASQITTTVMASSSWNSNRASWSRQQQQDQLAVLGISKPSMVESMERTRPVGPGELLATAPPMPRASRQAAPSVQDELTATTMQTGPMPAAHNSAAADSRLYQGGWKNVAFPEMQDKQSAEDLRRTTSPRDLMVEGLFNSIAFSSQETSNSGASSSKQEATALATSFARAMPTPPTNMSERPMLKVRSNPPAQTDQHFVSTVPSMESAHSSPPSTSANRKNHHNNNTAPSLSSSDYQFPKKSPFTEVNDNMMQDDEGSQAASFTKRTASRFKQLSSLARRGRKPSRERTRAAQSDTEADHYMPTDSRRGRKSAYQGRRIPADAAGSQSDTEADHYAWSKQMSFTRRGRKTAASSAGAQSDADGLFRSSAAMDTGAQSDVDGSKKIFQLSRLKKKVAKGRLRRRKEKGQGRKDRRNGLDGANMAGANEEFKARGPGVYLRDLDLIGDEVVEDIYADLDRQIEREDLVAAVLRESPNQDAHGGDGQDVGVSSTTGTDQETQVSEQEQSTVQSYLGSIHGMSKMTDMSQLTLDTATHDGHEDHEPQPQRQQQQPPQQQEEKQQQVAHDHNATNNVSPEPVVIPVVKKSSSGSTRASSKQSRKEKEKDRGLSGSGGGGGNNNKPNVLSGFMSYISGANKRNPSPGNSSENVAVTAASDQVEATTKEVGATRDPDGEKAAFVEEGLEPADTARQGRMRQEQEKSVAAGSMDPKASGTSAHEMKHPAIENVSDTPNIPISMSWNSKDGQQRATASPEGSPIDLQRPQSAPKKLSSRKFSSKNKKTIWKPALDPVSGRTYYYHRLTRKTTWTKPADLDTVVEEEEDLTERTTEPTETTERDEEAKVQEAEAANMMKQGSTDDMSVEDVLRKTRARDFEGGILQQKREIARLLKTMAPPDGKSIDNLMTEYEGRESELLTQLRDLNASRPFDEPLATDSVVSEEEATRSFQKAASLQPQQSSATGYSAASEFKGRVRTATSARSGRSGRTTRSGGTKISEKTELIKNTAKKRNMNTTARIDELGSASEGTSLSSEGMELRALSNGEAKKTENTKRPAPRTRELLVEELSYDRPKAETYDMRGVVRRSQRPGRPRPPVTEKRNESLHQHQYHHSNRSRPFTTPYTHDAYDDSTSRGSETLSRTTDSISALSMTDLDVSHSMQAGGGVDSARRRALDEAIAREDWDLAAALSEGMRTLKSKQTRGRHSGGEWTQSALDKFISQNDWDAVANYIAHVRARAKDDDAGKRMGASSPSSRQTSSFDTDDSSLRKRFGARSQLQHDDLQSESSWDSEDSRSSSASEETSSVSSYSEPSSAMVGQRRYSSASSSNIPSARTNNRRPPPPRGPRNVSGPKEFAC